MSSRYQLVRLRGGSWGIRSLDYDEICHPGVGPRAEAEALYVHGLDLPRRFRQHAAASAHHCHRDHEHHHAFVVWDVGLGGAANATAVIDAAQAFPLTLQLLSFDRTLAQLEFALHHAETLACFGSLAPTASLLLQQGFAHFAHGQARIEWSAHLGDFPSLLHSGDAHRLPAPHAILFDPHSPAANPEMWTLPLFEQLHRLTTPDRPCNLATYSRATAIRAALLLAGFRVGAGNSTESKEETTLAANRKDLIRHPLDQRWLARAQRSHAAEPWTTPPFGNHPLTPPTWDRLRHLPQFSPPTPPG